MRGRLPGGDELQCYCGILNGRWLLWLCVKGIMLLTEWGLGSVAESVGTLWFDSTTSHK